MLYRLIAMSAATLIAFSAFGFNLPSEIDRLQYIGSKSTEATLEFSASVEYESTRTPQEQTLRTIIESQLDHIVGPMSLNKFTAVPKGDHVVTHIKILNKKGNTFTVGYDYKGTIVLENGPKDSYDIFLPVNPKEIYAAAMVGNINPCTDHHYQSEGDFWYFWSPYRPGCALKEGRDFNIVKAKVKRIANTKISYPEYQNLPDENGNITVHVLFGMDDPSLDRNPLSSSDTNAYNYRTFRNYLLKNGYKATTWSDEQINAVAKTLYGDAPFVETIQKGKLIYRFFFGPTGINENALGFHWFYKDAIENASILVYEGHSGLGGHLDLPSIEEDLGTKINFNTKRYQIFFFDSCTSYRYYNTSYFMRKRTDSDPQGTKKLDIFTNGLSTLFSAMPQASMALDLALEKALNYAQSGNGFVSYQELAKQIDSNNLFGVNGDEDNVIPLIH